VRPRFVGKNTTNLCEKYQQQQTSCEGIKKKHFTNLPALVRVLKCKMQANSLLSP